MKPVSMKDWPCKLCGAWHDLFYVKMMDGRKSLCTFCPVKRQQTFLPYIPNLAIETRPSRTPQKVMASRVPKRKPQLELF